MKSPVHFLLLTNVVNAAKVLAISGTGALFACDLGIRGAESYDDKPWGYQNGRLINHALTVMMRHGVSSGNMALEYACTNEFAPENGIAVINHTDCDRIMSYATMHGDMDTLDTFGDAAISADYSDKPTPTPIYCKHWIKSVIAILNSNAESRGDWNSILCLGNAFPTDFSVEKSIGKLNSGYSDYLNAD